MPLDRPQLDTLISNLESGAITLQQSTDANTAAQTQAATCKAALDGATAANQQNVAALKAFVQALDPDGNDPAAVAPTPTSAGGAPAGATTPLPSDSGASAAPGGDGATVVPPTPAEAPAATGTAPAPASGQPTA